MQHSSPFGENKEYIITYKVTKNLIKSIQKNDYKLLPTHRKLRTSSKLPSWKTIISDLLSYISRFIIVIAVYKKHYALFDDDCFFSKHLHTLFTYFDYITTIFLPTIKYNKEKHTFDVSISKDQLKEVMDSKPFKKCTHIKKKCKELKIFKFEFVKGVHQIKTDVSKLEATISKKKKIPRISLTTVKDIRKLLKAPHIDDFFQVRVDTRPTNNYQGGSVALSTQIVKSITTFIPKKRGPTSTNRASAVAAKNTKEPFAATTTMTRITSQSLVLQKPNVIMPTTTQRNNTTVFQHLLPHPDLSPVFDSSSQWHTNMFYQIPLETFNTFSKITKSIFTFHQISLETFHIFSPRTKTPPPNGPVIFSYVTHCFYEEDTKQKDIPHNCDILPPDFISTVNDIIQSIMESVKKSLSINKFALYDIIVNIAVSTALSKIYKLLPFPQDPNAKMVFEIVFQNPLNPVTCSKKIAITFASKQIVKITSDIFFNTTLELTALTAATIHFGSNVTHTSLDEFNDFKNTYKKHLKPLAKHPNALLKEGIVNYITRIKKNPMELTHVRNPVEAHTPMKSKSCALDNNEFYIQTQIGNNSKNHTNLSSIFHLKKIDSLPKELHKYQINL